MKIIGHKKILDYFENIEKKGTLSHAYLFVGPPLIGKRTTAQFLAAKLLETPFEKVKIHPDFLFVKREKNEKTEKTKKNIDVEQIRKLRSFFSLGSYSKKHKIAIIDNAEHMNANASNALLKTLEEPGKNNILFLITTDPKNLPSTIVSRTQVLYFLPAEKTEIEKMIENYDMPEKQKQEIIEYSGGVVGKCHEFCNDEEYIKWYKTEVDNFISLFFCPFFDKINKIEHIFGDKTDHIATRSKIIEVLQIWLTVLSLFSREHVGITNSVVSCPKGVSSSALLEIEKRIYFAMDEIGRNVHPKLIIEHILLIIP